MRQPLAVMTVIACPHCGTRYQVPVETLGPRGREVSCAHCSKSWRALPGGATKLPTPTEDSDQLFDEVTERDLDAAFAAAEAAEAAELAGPDLEPAAPEQAPADDIEAPASPGEADDHPRVDPKLKQRRDRAFEKRQNSLIASLPQARIRRIARLGALGLLFTLIGGGIAFRTTIVRSLPDLAGVYAALGMPVNIVGLEFRDMHTLLALRSGANVLKIDARIYNTAANTVMVPPVVVTLLDDAGTALYEWSVAPEAADLERGELIDFTTQLNAPPAGATRVRLTFEGGQTQSENPVATATQNQDR